MKPYWRKLRNGSRVKYDDLPTNNYSDGYNARDRYWRKRMRAERIVWVALGMIIEVAWWALNN